MRIFIIADWCLTNKSFRYHHTDSTAGDGETKPEIQDAEEQDVP